MIIQKVIKGIGGINRSEASQILASGILCTWWHKVGILPSPEIPRRLIERNLAWHQNRYDDPDPTEGNEPFGRHTPFISTTAGTVDRDVARQRNVVYPAWQVALEFATDFGRRDGYLFYCYLFVLGRRSVAHPAFAEEIRELNVYTGFSTYQPEGEIVAKVIIPPTQIERFEYYDMASLTKALRAARRPQPAYVENNLAYYEPPEVISNIRGFLG